MISFSILYLRSLELGRCCVSSLEPCANTYSYCKGGSFLRVIFDVPTANVNRSWWGTAWNFAKVQKDCILLVSQVLPNATEKILHSENNQKTKSTWQFDIITLQISYTYRLCKVSKLCSINFWMLRISGWLSLRRHSLGYWTAGGFSNGY
jgi:hypothetical protein